MNGASRSIGQGKVVGAPATVTGIARFVADIQTVVEMMNADMSATILLVEDASATAVAPIIGDARAVVCTSGGPTSHLALVSKEFGVPCVVAAALREDTASLDGTTMTIGADGEISIAAEAG